MPSLPPPPCIYLLVLALRDMCCINTPQHGGYVWNDKSHVTTALCWIAAKRERGTGRHREGAMLGSPHTVACNAILSPSSCWLGHFYACDSGAVAICNFRELLTGLKNPGGRRSVFTNKQTLQGGAPRPRDRDAGGGGGSNRSPGPILPELGPAAC